MEGWDNGEGTVKVGAVDDEDDGDGDGDGVGCEAGGQCELHEDTQDHDETKPGIR